MGYSQQVKESAAKAAKRLRRNGWCQGEYQIGRRCCALGAIRKAENMDNDNSALAQAFAETIGVGPFGVHKWNDAPGRTKKEVIEVFDRIANS